ncbi:MAG: flagellar filament capping protein FliD, partial [Alphaproteobacteria bacterium]|nr:flagellar filament capping protein FliD [Alphaproteobacteria bacterium]
DYLSALNVGSGLNVTQIVDALVDAEKVPQESRIQKQLDERNISISSLGDVKSDLDIFKSNLDVYKGETGLIAQSTNDGAVGITNNGKIAVQPFTHSVSVTQLATSHTLAFLGYTSDTDAISADTIQIELGTWDSGGNFTPDADGTSATITIDSTNNTLQSFATAVNTTNINVTANVVRIDENSYALSMISPTGEARQMRVSALSGGATVHSLSYDDTVVHAGKLITAGQDADFTLDGLTVTRNTNSVDDIVNGMTIELKQTTTNPVGIGANYDKVEALANLTDFVTDLNFMINKLSELTYRGSPGSDDAGPLADDTLVKGYLRSFKRMTTTPLPGFQDQILYLSNFGVMTELDGSVSINETKFEEFFTANPDAFSAITNTRAVSDSNLVQAELSGTLWKTGTYEFEKTPTVAVAEVQTSSGGATASAVTEVQTATGTATALAVSEVQTATGTATASAHTIGDVYTLTVGSTTINTAASTATTDYDTVAKIAAALQTATVTAAVAEVQTASGAATASAHTIGDVYTLTVGSTTINTAASTATTDYDTVAKIAAALQTAATAASANFGVTESGGEFVITYNTAEDQIDEAVSMSFTAGTPGATFAAPTYSVTTQGADAYSAGFSVTESGGELVVTYDTAQTQADEAISMSFAAGTPGATFAPPAFSVTTQGAEAHTIGDVYTLTVGSTTINTAASTATTDYDTVAKVAAALQTAATAASAGFSITESSGELVVTYDTAQAQADEAISMSFAAGTPGAAFASPTFSVTTQGAEAHTIG